MSRKSWSLGMISFVASFAFAACGGGSKSAPPAATASQSVDSTGGTVKLADGAQVVIPAGALTTAQTITISSTATVPAGYVGESALYEFGPAGLQFSVPVAVTLPVRAGAVSPALYWSRAGDAGFDQLGGTVAANAISGMVSHFSQGFVAQSGGPSDGGADAASPDGAEPDAAGAAGAGGGAAGADAAAGADGGAAGAGGGAAACTILEAPVLDTKPMVGLPAPGGISSAAGTTLALSADGSLHVLGTSLFSAADGETFAPNNKMAAAGPFVVDPINNWIYLAQTDRTNKLAIFRYPTTGGCLQRMYDFPAGVLSAAPLGVTNGDVIFVAGGTAYVGAKGVTWTVGGSALISAAANNLGTNAALSPSNPKRLWIGGSTTYALGTMQVSTDGGLTFPGRSAVPSGTILTGAGEAFVYPDPTNELMGYALVTGAASGVYKTVDGGLSWPLASKLSTPTANELVDGLRLGADGTLYASTRTTAAEVGLYKRASGAAAWTAFNGDLPAGEIPVKSFTVREKAGAPMSIVRLSATGALWRSEDAGLTYAKVPVTGLPALTITFFGTDPDSATTFYANDPTFHLWKTVDAGKTFTAAAVGYVGFATVLPGGELLLTGGLENGSSGNLFHSADGGATVQAAGTGLPPDALIQSANGRSPIIVGKAAKTAYLMYGLGGMDATARGKLFLTTDGGVNWAASGTFLPTADSGNGWVLADPTTAHRLYRFMTPNAGNSTFSISTDDGANWTDVALPAPSNGGAISLSEMDLAIDHTGRLYARIFGLYTLPSGTTTWQPITGATGTATAVGNYLYVGTGRSSDGGATFKMITSVADYSFDWLISSTAFAHRADPTLWLSDASGNRSAPSQGLLVGHIP